VGETRIFELKFFPEKASGDLLYDEGADVLYLSLGKPRPALGMDIGDGIILRYDETKNEVVGLTILGLRARFLEELAAEEAADSRKAP
jgi:uncharacterized protein YuzE